MKQVCASHHLRRTPANVLTDTEGRWRDCLSCDEPFWSPHKGVRRCADCKKDEPRLPRVARLVRDHSRSKPGSDFV